VRPLGFVCADGDATVRLDAPVPRAFAVEPDRSQPLPYAYAIARRGAPSYLAVPTRAEQLRAEPDLEPAPEVAPPAPAAARFPVGAKSVPPEPAGLVNGPALPSDATPSVRRDTADDAGRVPWWLEGARQLPDLAPSSVDRGGLAASRAGVALLGAFVSPAASDSRPFAITTEARLMPADKLDMTPGSAFQGRSLLELELPVAFGWREDARFWALEAGRLEPRRRLEPRELISLTGAERVMGGAHMLEARGGQWLRSAELRVVAKPSELPRFARGGQRWIDVSREAQTLVLWEGDRAVYATLASIGKTGSAESGRTQRAPRGVFRILQKHVSTSLGVGGSELALRDVPWVMTIAGGYALYGAYWHDDFGRERARGGVELAPRDARHVFEWSLPDVPEHWHGAYAGASFGDGTLLRIGP
jgi:hypothetical protein